MFGKCKKVLAAVLVLGCVMNFAGCGDKNTAKKEESVTLKWIFGGPGKQRDSDEVYALFNEKLQEKMPGVQVNFECIATSDYAEKWRLIAASNEKVDIAWCGWVLDYLQEIESGSYLELNELIDEYAPNLKKSMPDWCWDVMRVNGKLYTIPIYQMMVTRPLGLRTYKDLYDAYFDEEAMEKAVEKNMKAEPGAAPWNDEMFDVLDDYLSKLQEAGKLGMGMSPEVSDWIPEVNYLNGDLFGSVYVSYDAEGKPIAKDAFADSVPDTFYKRMAEFYKKGYIRKDVLTLQDYKKDIGTEGGYVLWPHVFDRFTEESESKKYGKEIKIIPVSTKAVLNNKPFATNTSLPRTCENPETAMKFLELINSEEGAELYNLLVYGIEGKHYTKVGDNRIETIGYSGSATVDSPYGIPKWMIGDTFHAYQTQTDPEGYNDFILNELHQDFIRSKLLGFSFDSTNVKVERAQLNNVKKEFSGLRFGAFEDYEATLKEFKDKIHASGQEKVVRETQKQLDEWYESTK